LPAIISAGEKLATYSKALASKVGVSWSMEADGSSCHQQKDKVVDYCQKLLKAVDTAHHNMEELVAKVEGKYGTANIQQDCR
jgi:hypothetical protein